MEAMLATIGFLAPWMVWGAVAAVGLPVLAHLLSRTHYRDTVFPAARFVQQAVAATSRVETPRHRMLMLLRWLVLILLVIAFMRPQWTPDAQATDGSEGIALVLMIDASASMQRTADGLSLMDRAKSHARRLIDQLDPSRDTATVIRVGHTSSPLLPEPTSRFGLLSERLLTVEAGYTQANWAVAAAHAQRLSQDERRKLRLVTLSDQQGEQPDLVAEHLLIDGPTENAAIRLVDVRPYPAIQGQPVSATFEVEYFGEQPVKLQLSTQFASQLSTESLMLAPGETRRIGLRLPNATGKNVLVETSIDTPDAIDADNIAGASIPIQIQTRALVIHDDTNQSASIAKRIASLLNPGEVRGATLPSIELAQVNDAVTTLASTDPAELRTVVLLGQADLPDELSRGLETYAQAGGGIIQFAGDYVTTPDQTTTASDIDFGLQALQLFQGPARTGLASLLWPGVTNQPIDPAANEILADEQGLVIVAEMQRGRGRLIAINAALQSGPGGLLAEPSFVVLFNELCRYASPGSSLPPPAKPGDPLPDSLLNTSNVVMPESAKPDSEQFTTPGRYAVMREDGGVDDLIYVQLDPYESDTSRPAAWTNPERAPTTNEIEHVQAIAGSLTSEAIELWPYFVLGVLGLLVTESLLLRQFAGKANLLTEQGGAV